MGVRQGCAENMGSRSGKPVLKVEDVAAFSKSSGLSEDEVKDTFENFISRHPNGKMKPKDFGEIMSTALPAKDARKMTQHAFRIYDLNNDGYVDFAEFMVVFFILAEGDPKEVLTKIFRLFDVNGDGSISRKELSRLVKDMYGLLKTDNPDIAAEDIIARDAFEEMDKDNDGKITEAEFLTACLGEAKLSKMLSNKAMEIFME